LDVFYAFMMAVGLLLYAWLLYRCMVLAGEKKFPVAVVVLMCILTTPIVVLIMLTFVQGPSGSGERRLSAEELTAVFEAKAARIEAARGMHVHLQRDEG